MVHYNSDLASEPFLMPGMDIRIKLSERMDLFTSLSRSMRMPTFTDLFYQGPTNVGNPYLLPEKATTVELGIQRKNKQWHSAISSFYRQGRDLIDWVWLEDEKWHTRNLTEIDAAGGSFFLKHQPDSPASLWISLESWKLSYTFTYLTKVSEAYISRYLLDNLKHKISMASHFSIVKNFGLFLGLSFQDRNGGFLLYDEASGGTQEQAYQPFVLMDLKLSYSFKRFHLYLKSNNVLNADYYDIGNVIQPGRWSMAGIEFR